MLVFADFVELSATDIGAGVGAVEFLNDFLDGDATGGAEKEFEFVEVFFSAFDGLPIGADREEDGLFGDYLIDEGVALLWRGAFAFLSEGITELAFLIWSVVHGNG